MITTLEGKNKVYLNNFLLQVSQKSLGSGPKITVCRPTENTHFTKVCRLRRKTFLFLLCFLLLFLRSADYVGRPYCFCSVSYYYYFSFLFFSTAVFLLGFLRHFSIDLNQIWHIDSS